MELICVIELMHEIYRMIKIPHLHIVNYLMITFTFLKHHHGTYLMINIIFIQIIIDSIS